MIPLDSSLSGMEVDRAVEISHRRLGPKALTRWLTRLVPSLSERWIEEIERRGHTGSAGDASLVERFAGLIVRLLPLMLGPHRDQIQPLWDRAGALYGAIAAKRGLAAGEALEELHLLRELVIRDLYRDPPAGGRVRLSLREILRMNRALDRAVTHVSVGHTDTLFFDFFESDGAGAILAGPDALAEAERQLESISQEVEALVRHAAGNGAG
jgi:hypothetical protein